MTSMTAGDVLVNTLTEWGVGNVFGIPGPALIEATVDPNEPPMPPKIEAKQAMNFAQALAKGTPGGGKIALTVASDKVRELV